MRRTFAPAFAAILLIGAPAAAALAQCPAGPGAPAFAVDVRQPPVAYTLATADTLLTQAHANGTPLGRGRGVLGLTVNRYEIGLRLTVETMPAAAGICARLRAVSVTVAANPQVLSDARYAPETCQRIAIIDHENGHVAVFRDAIAEAEPALDAALRHAALPPSIEAATRAAAEEAYARAIRAAIDPVLAAVRDRTAAENAELDTPAHYAEVFRRCSAW